MLCTRTARRPTPQPGRPDERARDPRAQRRSPSPTSPHEDRAEWPPDGALAERSARPEVRAPGRAGPRRGRGGCRHRGDVRAFGTLYRVCKGVWHSLSCTSTQGRLITADRTHPSTGSSTRAGTTPTRTASRSARRRTGTGRESRWPSCSARIPRRLSSALQRRLEKLEAAGVHFPV